MAGITTPSNLGRTAHHWSTPTNVIISDRQSQGYLPHRNIPARRILYGQCTSPSMAPHADDTHRSGADVTPQVPEEEARIRRLVDAVDLWSTDEVLRRQAVAHSAAWQQQTLAYLPETPLICHASRPRAGRLLHGDSRVSSGQGRVARITSALAYPWCSEENPGPREGSIDTRRDAGEIRGFPPGAGPAPQDRI
jgi:hypothetical protein